MLTLFQAACGSLKDKLRISETFSRASSVRQGGVAGAQVSTRRMPISTEWSAMRSRCAPGGSQVATRGTCRALWIEGVAAVELVVQRVDRVVARGNDDCQIGVAGDEGVSAKR